MKKSILVSFSFIFLIIAIYSQEKTTSVIPSKSVTDKNKPSVYITFERFGGSEPIVKSNEDKSARISLRLHNNTSLPIAVDANWDIRKVTPFPITLSDGGKGVTVSDGAELEICYEAEAMPQRKVEEFLKIQVPKQIPSYYNCRLGLQRSGRSDTWIRSGNSIVFSVPQEFLTKNLKIYTLFNYEWESENGQMKADEPHHQVYFYSTDLPSGVASKVEVDVRKPSVYISFERLGGNKPLVKSQEHSTDRIFLRLHNNTALPIAIDADGEYTIDTLSPITLSDGGKGFALPDGAEVEVCYQSEAMRLRTAEEFARIQVPKQIPSYYSCSWQSQRGGRGNLWIPAGSSIVFSVPREFLGKNLKIYTLFNYEWESENGQMKADEPHHQVYFYSTDLPYELQQK